MKNLASGQYKVGRAVKRFYDPMNAATDRLSVT